MRMGADVGRLHKEVPEEFVIQCVQVASTRNIEANMFNDWFTGGLNRQIEHHLFPTMPRHNLNKISSHVRALCEKHGLVYEDLNITLGTYRVVEALAEVAAAATITVASS